MNQKKDLRIIKTNNALFNALLSLMKEKTFEEIKISDICSCALINRSTFYAHYEDKYELLIALLENTKTNLLNELIKNDNEINSKEYFMEILKILINHVDDNKEIYTAILQNNKNGILMDILMDVVDRYLSQTLKQRNDIKASNLPERIITRFYIGSIIGIGIEWIKNPEKYTKEQIISYLGKLIPDKL